MGWEYIFESLVTPIQIVIGKAEIRWVPIDLFIGFVLFFIVALIAGSGQKGEQK